MISFYKNYSDAREVVKNIDKLFDLNGEFTHDNDILTPSFTVMNAGNYYGANYCYISEYERYYFIDRIVHKNGGIQKCYCRVDPLMTWASQIKNLDCKILRNENKGFTLLEDTKVVFTSQSDISVYRFPMGFNSSSIGFDESINYLVTMIGG